MDPFLINLFGVIGGFCFAYCGVPQAYSTVMARKHLGTPITISASISTGSIFMYLYLYLSHGFDWIVTVNYSVGFLSWFILLCFGLKDKNG